MIDFRHITTEAVQREIRRRYHTVSVLFRRTLTGVLGAIVVLGVAACGSGSAGDALPDDITAETLGLVMSAFVSGSVETLATGDFDSLAEIQLAVESPVSSCTPNVSGSAPNTDADSDGIESNRTETYDCPVGSSKLLVGEFNITDKDDGDPNSGYTLNTAGEPLRVLESGQELGSLDIDIDVTRSGDSFNGAYEVRYTAPGDASLDYSANLSFEAGNIQRTEGLINYSSGRIIFVGDGSRYDLDITSSDLYYDESCDGNGLFFFDRGSITFDDGQGNTVMVSFDCNNDPTVTTSL